MTAECSFAPTVMLNTIKFSWGWNCFSCSCSQYLQTIPLVTDVSQLALTLRNNVHYCLRDVFLTPCSANFLNIENPICVALKTALCLPPLSFFKGWISVIRKVNGLTAEVITVQIHQCSHQDLSHFVYLLKQTYSLWKNSTGSFLPSLPPPTASPSNSYKSSSQPLISFRSSGITWFDFLVLVCDSADANLRTLLSFSFH